ncbi:MAG: NAD(+)/NADH kinase [Verrucomicrobiales bacterium]|nr:NAD(+)/NADH kinase [Verrucomicrobiales bacterium]
MKVALIYKKSVWELFSNSKDSNVSSYISGKAEAKEAFQESHQTQQNTIQTVKNTLSASGAEINMVYRSEITESVISSADLVISVGGDGTFLETSHYITDTTPMLGVNSDPFRSVGFFCSCTGDNFEELFNNVNNGPRTNLSRISLKIDGISVGPPVLNDLLFANPNPAATTRYEVEGETYRNSGILISTAAGSTAWSFQEGLDPLPLTSDKFQFIHRGTREPASGITSSVKIDSLTRKGKLFIDGEHYSLPLCIGQSLEIKCGQSINVIGDLELKRSQFIQQYLKSS